MKDPLHVYLSAILFLLALTCCYLESILVLGFNVVPSHLDNAVLKFYPSARRRCAIATTTTATTKPASTCLYHSKASYENSNDPYQILDLEPPASCEKRLDKRKVRIAYKSLAKIWHPDVITNASSSPEEKQAAHDRFAKINWAYDALLNGELAVASNTKPKYETVADEIDTVYEFFKQNTYKSDIRKDRWGDVTSPFDSRPYSSFGDYERPKNNIRRDQWVDHTNRNNHQPDYYDPTDEIGSIKQERMKKRAERMKAKKQQEEDRLAAEEEAKKKMEEEARIAAEKERIDERLKLEEEARIMAEQEAARLKAEEEIRAVAQQEAAILEEQRQAQEMERIAARLRAEAEARAAAQNFYEEGGIGINKERLRRRAKEMAIMNDQIAKEREKEEERLAQQEALRKAEEERLAAKEKEWLASLAIQEKEAEEARIAARLRAEAEARAAAQNFYEEGGIGINKERLRRRAKEMAMMTDQIAKEREKEEKRLAQQEAQRKAEEERLAAREKEWLASSVVQEEEEARIVARWEAEAEARAAAQNLYEEGGIGINMERLRRRAKERSMMEENARFAAERRAAENATEEERLARLAAQQEEQKRNEEQALFVAKLRAEAEARAALQNSYEEGGIGINKERMKRRVEEKEMMELKIRLEEENRFSAWASQLAEKRRKAAEDDIDKWQQATETKNDDGDLITTQERQFSIYSNHEQYTNTIHRNGWTDYTSAINGEEEGSIPEGRRRRSEVDAHIAEDTAMFFTGQLKWEEEKHASGKEMYSNVNHQSSAFATQYRQVESNNHYPSSNNEHSREDFTVIQPDFSDLESQVEEVLAKERYTANTFQSILPDEPGN